MLDLFQKLFPSKQLGSSEQDIARAQQKMKWLQKQQLIYLREKRQEALKNMAQASAVNQIADNATAKKKVEWID